MTRFGGYRLGYSTPLPFNYPTRTCPDKAAKFRITFPPPYK